FRVYLVALVWVVQRRQIRPRAEISARAPLHRHPQCIVALEGLEGRSQGIGHFPVDGIALLGMVQDDRADRPPHFGDDRLLRHVASSDKLDHASLESKVTKTFQKQKSRALIAGPAQKCLNRYWI